MSQAACPLCRCPDLSMVEEIRVPELCEAYAASFGIDVAREFSGCDSLSYLACAECGLHFFTPAVTGSDAFYAALQKFDWYYMAEKWEFDRALEHIAPGAAVLEVGCGRGLFSRKVGHARYTGLETSDSAIRLSAELGVPVAQETVERHAQSHAGAYDVVCSFQVLEHVPDPHGFIAACCACLKPGGTLLLSTPNMESFLKYAVNGVLDAPPHHVTRWQEKTWRSLERLFPLKLLRLVQEPLQEYHRRYYATTVSEALARSVLGLPLTRVVNMSQADAICREIAHRLAEPLARVLADPSIQPVLGHTSFCALTRVAGA